MAVTLYVPGFRVVRERLAVPELSVADPRKEDPA
jgi:hypothetical protein